MHNVQICPRLTRTGFLFTSFLFSQCSCPHETSSSSFSQFALFLCFASFSLPLADCVFSQYGWLELVCLWAGLFAYWGLFSPLVLKDLFTESHYDVSCLQCWMRNGLFALWALMFDISSALISSFFQLFYFLSFSLRTTYTVKLGNKVLHEYFPPSLSGSWNDNGCCLLLYL